MVVATTLRRAVRPVASKAMAPRQPMLARQARFYTEGPKPQASGPKAESSSPPKTEVPVSRVTGTSHMLFYSAAALVAASAAFLMLPREEKKATVGVGLGSGDDNKLKGSKHRALSGGANANAVGVQSDGTKAGSMADYQKVYNAIAEKLEKDPEYDQEGHYGPVLVRLAWHCSGTYCKDTGTGGSNGATQRFAPEANWGANAGLIHARNFMEDIKKQFPWVTYSDLWTLGGVVAVQEMGGPNIYWRPGRSDRGEEHTPPDGRLPDGDKGADHLRHIFYRMGFNDQEIVALSGFHAVGRCHKDRSGFEGPWQHSPTSFNNEYFRLLFNEKWQFKKWDGPVQYEDKSTKSLMMLTTDMALTQDKSFRKYAEKYAQDEETFFKDASNAFAKLLELGVPEENFRDFEADHSGKPYLLKALHEQE